MKKFLLAAVVVLLLAVAGGVWYLLANLDHLVKVAIETYGSQATQTAVSVDKVQIGLKEGSARIDGLNVANLPGFAAPQIFTLGEIATRIDLESLSQEVLVIDEIVIRAPQVFFELDAGGRNNLSELNARLAGGSGAAKAQPAATGSEPKLIIRKLVFADGMINARVALPQEKTYDLKLPAIEMRDLGGKNGATAAQLSEQILKKLTEKAQAEVRSKIIDQQVEQLKAQAKERLGAETQKATDKLKGLLNR